MQFINHHRRLVTAMHSYDSAKCKNAAEYVKGKKNIQFH